MSCETLEDANDRIKQLERENLQLKQLLEDKQSGNSIDENKELQKAMATEQELRLIKALLLLQNVDVDVKLNENSKPRKVLLSGDEELLEDLMTLRKQIRLLKQHNLVIRAQFLQLKLAIPQLVKWVQQSAYQAIESHAQQRKDLQHRLSRLKSVLKS